MNDGLRASDREAICGVLAQFPAIQKAVLFGSRATGTYSPASDIDLVLYGESLTLSDESRIASKLEDTDLPFRVDLVRYATITSKDLLSHIRRDGTLFYAPSDRADAPQKRTVGDYVTLQRGTTYSGSLVGEPGPALLGLGSIEPGGGFRHGQYKTYGGDCPENLMLYPGDLYAALKGATKDGKMIGSVARVPASVPSGRLTQDTVKLVFKDPDPGESKYLYWALRTPQYRSYCEGHAMGSAVVALSRRDFLAFPVPPLNVERAKAISLLEHLEEKIELNRRMNETLEAMAQAIFKSWFVDFEPVRAKADGRDPGLPRNLADLFPDSFENSELGRAPRGWRVGTILDDAQLLSGGTPRTDRDEYWNGNIPWTTAKDISQCGHPFLAETERRITRRGLEESTTQLIPALSSVIVARGATTGRMAMLGDTMAMNQTCYALSTSLSSPFSLYCQLRNEIEKLVHAAHGSVFDTITTNTFRSSKVLLPPRPLIERFEQYVAPLFFRILGGIKEGCTLAALRDTLLPKLLSGELRVKDAERRIEEAG